MTIEFPEHNLAVVDGKRFQLITYLPDLWALRDEDGFVLGKTRRNVDKLLQHISPDQVTNMVELGIFRGGSVAFFASYLKPKRLAAIDLMPPVALLEDWIDQTNSREQIRTYYGTDQSDGDRLNAIVDEVCGDEPLDLVVDDASHLLDPTRASFNALFPRLRPGGLYLIEDWSVYECFRDYPYLMAPEFLDVEPMSSLIRDILHTSARKSSVVEEIIANDGFAIARRGPDPLDRSFDIRNYA